MNRVIAFKAVLAVIALLLLFFQRTIIGKLAAKISQERSRRILRITYWIFAGSGQLVLWYAILYPGRSAASTMPTWLQPYYGALLAINYSHLVWLVPLALFWLIAGLYHRMRAAKQEKASAASEAALSRNEFLRRLAGVAATGINLLPATTGVAAISGIFLGSREIVVLPREFRIDGLHDDLKGLRIVQISDIHIGNLIGEKYLQFTYDLIKNAKPDYIVVTGDIIDNNNAFLPVAQNYFARLNALLNRRNDPAKTSRLLGVLGNHDLIDDGLVAATSLTRCGLKILRNEIVSIKQGRGMLEIGGLDYPPLGRGRSETMKTYFAWLQAKRNNHAPLILLNHNPADFEYLKNQNIDLVLSGHTHGGQINFARSQSTLINAAGWVYKYYVDYYQEQGSQLYVNRGLGHWFPLRVNCPPEITVITLV